jgi:protein-S-isoprenylcysteine O-methyltransferase Ste14
MVANPGKGPSVVVGTLGPVVLAGAALFVGAGTLDWVGAWAFLGLLLLARVPILIYLGRKDPELMRARRNVGTGTPTWDRIWLMVFVGTAAATLVVAGLDAARFRWTQVEMPWMALGLLPWFAGLFIGTRAMLVNTHFETTVRIQEDRGHAVVSEGPYRLVRHPGYVAAILVIFSAPLLLGSWWAFAPAGVMGVLFVLRTALEDRKLRRELDGYAAYAGQVRARLIPGIW